MYAVNRELIALYQFILLRLGFHHKTSGLCVSYIQPTKIIQISYNLLEKFRGVTTNAFHQKMVKSFRTKINEIQAKIDKAYDDKLEGKITEELWASKFKQWSDQKENLQIKLNAQQKANKSYYETGVRLIELSNRAYELYEKQNVKEKQKLLKFLLSNSKMQGNTVDFVLKMPFSLIVESKKSKNWLGWLDSNQRSQDQNPVPCRLATPQYVPGL